MKVYRVGIVGLTGIAARPAPAGPARVFGLQAPHSHAASYAAIPATRVVAVCDLVPQLLQDFEVHWGSTWGDIAAYTDYRQMFAHENLDILSVVTPDHRHADIVVDAVAAGVAGIFCEKPIATSLSDADRMIEAVERAGVAMTINHTRRWLPQFHRARDMICSGELGGLSRIVAYLGGPRAMLFRNGTHTIDMINFFAESDAQWVVGELDPGEQDYGPVYAGDGGHDPNTDPGATAYIHYHNGVSALYCGTKRAATRNEFDLLCEKGRIRVSPGLVEIQAPIDRGGGPVAVRRLTWPQVQFSDSVAAIRELIDVMEHGGESQCPPREARKVLEIILAILISQDLGCVRVDLPITETPSGPEQP